MSYMNRPHSAALTQSLKNHGMDIKRPSQLSDAFRLGWWAAEKEAKQQRAELLEALKETVCALECCGKDYPAMTRGHAAITRAEVTE